MPMINSTLFQLILGMVLSDASIYRISRQALVKFEQGVDQKAFLFHLFDMCSEYCFMLEPGVRYYIRGPKVGLVKSYWFKTFSHTSFSVIWDLFYLDNKKTIRSGIITNHLDTIGLAYWIIGDGSLHREGRVLTLHTQGFSWDKNNILSSELNAKFGFNTKVVAHKNITYVIQFSTKDANKLHDIINLHIIPEMKYKVPRKLLWLKI